jgi:uncharacterized protein YfaS (alpha-2-macroglobulin family)
MNTIKKIAVTVAVVLGLGVSAKAQTPIYRPGDVIKVTVTFSGPDADRIKKISAEMQVPEVSTDQAGFSNDLQSQDSSPAGPHTFTVSLKVPETQATGDYKLRWVTAYAAEPNVNVSYVAPADFTAPTFRIENRTRFVKPAIQSIH